MAISKQILKKIKANKVLMAKLCAETGKSYPTIHRWVRTNSDQLTMAVCLKVICKELNVSREAVLPKLEIVDQM